MSQYASMPPREGPPATSERHFVSLAHRPGTDRQSGRLIVGHAWKPSLNCGNKSAPGRIQVVDVLQADSIGEGGPEVVQHVPVRRDPFAGCEPDAPDLDTWSGSDSSTDPTWWLRALSANSCRISALQPAKFSAMTVPASGDVRGELGSVTGLFIDISLVVVGVRFGAARRRRRSIRRR